MKRYALKVLAGFAAIHLLLVIWGAFHQWRMPGGLAWQWIGAYAALSGADNDYPFFAPGIGSQFRVRFEIQTPGADGQHDTLQVRSHESRLRIVNIVNLFWSRRQDPSVQRALAASWAGKMFSAHPNARAVTVNVEAVDIPSMAEARAGKKIEWKNYYSGIFSREN